MAEGARVELLQRPARQAFRIGERAEIIIQFGQRAVVDIDADANRAEVRDRADRGGLLTPGSLM
jgi:hypothetical protein